MDPWDPSSDRTVKQPRPIRVATSPLVPWPRSSPNRSSPHGTLSPNSSQSSLYLSPPFTDSESEEAPYRPSAGDRISLDMHNSRKGRRKSRYRQNPQPLATVGRDRPSNQLWPIKELYQSGPPATSLNLGDSVSEGSGSFETKVIRSKLQRKAQGRGSISVRSKKGSQNALQESKPSRKRASTMSRAQSSRRSEGEKLTDAPRKRRRWTLIGDGLSPSTSFATAVAGRHPGDKAELVAHSGPIGTARPPPPTRKESTQRNRAFRYGSCCRKGSQGQKYDTPATITLRKASKIYQCEKISAKPEKHASQAHQSHVAPQPTLKSGRSDSMETGSQPSPMRATSAISNAYAEAHFPRTVTLATIGGEPQDRAWIRRPTMTAEPALTYAEVHTSPKVFPSAGTSSRKHSLLAMDMMRRYSAVQVRSGGSVHEIIWDKDDTPSTRSANSNDTLSPDVLPTTTRNNSDDKVTTTSALQLAPQGGNQRESDFFQNSETKGKVFGASDDPQAAEKLICWSWQKAEVSSTPNAQAGSAKGREATPALVPASSRTNARRRDQSSDLSPILGIQSFPPLLDRHSTYEWIKAPLVDLNDPLAGREATGSGDNPSSQSDPNDAKDGAQSHKFSQAEPDYHSKSRKPSRVGEAIGISHGHRRPSTVPNQQRPYKSLLDVSKSVSWKASAIGYSFSDLALGSRAGGAASVKAPVEDPLGDMPPNPIIWGAEGLSVVSQWRNNSSSGLRINTMVSQPMPRLIEVAGSHSEEAG
ncbi:hypothetical protein MMC30_009240 [Trapelia coarctata]|nr:hypothetical protein [Trapelia coarctata]